MPWVLLALGFLSALLTLSALRPVRWPTSLGIVSFFAGWLTGDLPVVQFLAQGIAAVLLIAAGGLQAWPGYLGLVVLVISWAGLVRAYNDSCEADEAVEEALASVGVPPAERSPWSPLQLLLPFWLYHPRVRVKMRLPILRIGRWTMRANVFRPRGKAEGRPVLVFVHGGGWVVRFQEFQGIPVMLRLAAEGWVCISVTYRLSPWSTFPAHLIDVKRGIAWARQNAHRWGGDPSLFFALHGNSAGAHLTSLAALTPNDPRYQPGFEEVDTRVDVCVPMYGPLAISDAPTLNLDFKLMFDNLIMKRSRTRHPDAFQEASPIDRLRRDAPPFFVVHGSMDSLVPVEQSRRFVAAWREQVDAPIGYAEIPNGQHALDIFHSRRGVVVADGIKRFLVHACQQHTQKLQSTPQAAQQVRG